MSVVSKYFLFVILMVGWQSRLFAMERIENQLLRGAEEQSVIKINNSVMQSIITDGGYFVIVTPNEVEIIRAGTRSEMAVIHVSINDLVYGEIKEPLVLTIFTHDGKTPLEKNVKYLVALKDVPLYRPRLWLEAHQKVDCVDCKEYVENFISKLNQLSKK